MSDWISVKNQMPNVGGLLRVKIDTGEEFDGYACRNGNGEWTIQPWVEYVKFWKYE